MSMPLPTARFNTEWKIVALTGCDSFVCETYRIAAWPSLLYFLIFRPPHLEFALIYLSIPL